MLIASHYIDTFKLDVYVSQLYATGFAKRGLIRAIINI